MKHITFYLDFSSPDSYAAFEEMPVALMGLSYRVTYKPIVLAQASAQRGDSLAPALAIAELAVASDAQGLPNRYMCEMLFKQVAQLNTHTDEALALGVTSVPTLVVDGQLFFGPDVLANLRTYLDTIESMVQGVRR